MRLIIFVLALIAGAKIWIQEGGYRTAAEEVILRAYQTQAADACTRAATDLAQAGIPDIATDWSSGVEAHFSAGNPALPVRIWDFDNEQWNARFRQAHLILSQANARASCSYDIVAGKATIEKRPAT